MKRYKKRKIIQLLSLFLLAATQQTKAYCPEKTPNHPSSPVLFNSHYAYDMLDDTTRINQKQLYLLRARQNGLLDNHQLYLSASGIFIGDTQSSNRSDKFGYLMRHPTSANQVGKMSSELLIHNGKLGVTGTICNWITGHLQFLYYPNQSFGGGTNVNVNRNQIELRRGYILLGDLNFLPIYVSLGKMAAPFGLTDTVNPFTASTVWHAFGGHAYGAIIGLDTHGVNASIMLVQGGAQFRALNSGHPTPSRVENAVYNASYTYNPCDDICIKVGASYEEGSAYVQGFPVLHFETFNRFKNPAWIVYGQIDFHNLRIIGEFASTTKKWPGTHNPYPPLNVFCASKVSSFDIGARYTFDFIDCIKLATSVDFSNFKAGPSRAPWERQNQIVVGLEAIVKHNVRFFMEYVHTQGYVPLNLISGNTPAIEDDGERVPATTHSDRDARSNVIIVGAKIAF